MMPSILFVCLGNICRSPLAEGIFREMVTQAGRGGSYRIDSAGTGGWHSGERPDPRSIAVAQRHGIELIGRARQVTPDDFLHFDVLVAMDQENAAELERMAASITAPRGRVVLLLDFHPSPPAGNAVPDPYYGGDEGFDRVFTLLQEGCRGLLAALDAGAGSPS